MTKVMSDRKLFSPIINCLNVKASKMSPYHNVDWQSGCNLHEQQDRKREFMHVRASEKAVVDVVEIEEL